MKRGLVRVIMVNLLCLTLICCLSANFFIPQGTLVAAVKNQSDNIPASGEKENKNAFSSSSANSNAGESSSQEKPSAEAAENSVSSEAKPTSAQAVKGKIISQYNSPYLASLSYDGVYVKNSTDLKINLKEFVNGEVSFKVKKNDDPQVLILHTHATESFMETDSDYYTEDFKSRTGDNEKNMVAIGKIVAEKLQNAGINTIHSATQHDYPSYSKSYSRAADTICDYFKKYPSIKVVIDLHRDAVSAEDNAKVKLVTNINNKKAAQIMLVMGSQSGSVTNFPKWKENFKLATKLQRIIEKDYPTLARPIMLMSKNYNESLSTGSMLIEIGTEANSLDEAKYSAELVGNSLVKLLSSLN